MRVVSLMCLILAVLITPIQVKAQASMASAASILMYHRFGEGKLPSTNIRIEQLEAHIALLTSGPYTVLPLDEVVVALQYGTPLPPNAVVITVDDAYRSFVTEGWPRFKAAGLPVTWFLNTAAVKSGAVGTGGGAPTWDEVRRLRDEGVTFGVHSHAHPHLPTLTPQEQEADLDRALALFEQELGLRPKTFAYPYGEADRAAMDLMAAKGFVAAFGQHSGVAWGGDDRWYLPRFALNEQYGAPDRFRRVIDALPLPATDVVPTSPVVRGTSPVYGFTVTQPDLPLDRIACYGPSGKLAAQIVGPRVEVRMGVTPPPGRTRINCTLPGPRTADGIQRWHWRGTQFVVLP